MIETLALMGLAVLTPPQEQPPHEPPGADFEPPGWKLELLPGRDLYRPYLADPRQSRSSVKVQFPIDPRKGNLKIENCLGASRPLALWTDPNDPDEEAGLSLEAGVFSRFDISEDWDMDGADYRFGFPFSYRRGDVTMKLHVWHLTSHLGDEYMTRNPEAERASYHNDEAALGLSWQATPPLRAYAEIGYGIYTGPDTGKGRVQVGLECVGEPWKGRLIPYAALDLSTRKELDWEWNLSTQGGLLVRSRPDGNGFRFLLEYYRGRDQQTQFKSDREHYLAVGASAGF